MILSFETVKLICEAVKDVARGAILYGLVALAVRVWVTERARGERAR
jgi:hypothetical protein